jgi:hypothetical protein
MAGIPVKLGSLAENITAGELRRLIYLVDYAEGFFPSAWIMNWLRGKGNITHIVDPVDSHVRLRATPANVLRYFEVVAERQKGEGIMWKDNVFGEDA